MVRLATRKEVCEKWERSDICPNIIKRVQSLCTDSRTCRAYLSKPGEFEVVDGKSTLPVSLNNHTCACNLWQISGIPCKHGMRAILMAGLDPHRFVSDWYSVSKYKLAYANGISPIPDREQWPENVGPVIEPPVMKRGVGRPARNRKRAPEEERKGKRSNTIRCSLCQTYGHNMKTCKGGPTKNQQKSDTTTKNSRQRGQRFQRVRARVQRLQKS